MTDVEDLLALPERARLSQRLTKKEIVGQYEVTSPIDARLLNRVVTAATIVGVLRPETISVPTYQDAERRADVIPVLTVTVASGTRAGDVRRVAELLHRSMPRPAVLMIKGQAGTNLLSLALTRLSKTDSDGETSVIEASLLVPVDQIATHALAVHRLDRGDLWTLYRDLVRTAAADGRPASASLTAGDAIALRQRLDDLAAELEVTVRSAKREKNVQRRIDLNTEGKRLRACIAEAKEALFAPSAGDSTPTTTSPDTDGDRTL